LVDRGFVRLLEPRALRALRRLDRRRSTRLSNARLVASVGDGDTVDPVARPPVTFSA
jgi:hypothetical protein